MFHQYSSSFNSLASVLKQKSAVESFLDISDWKNPVAITLTMKEGQVIDRTFVELRPELCRQNLRHFRNVLNRKAFKNASYKLKMKCLAVLEQSADGRYHYHLALDRPECFSDLRLRLMVNWVWRNTHWGREQTAYESPADQGWISYMTKLKTKPSYLDAFDWDNCHLG